MTFPRADVPTAVLVSTCGGLTGGDRVRLNLGLEDGEAVVTTQAAEKIYRSEGEDVVLDLEIDVDGVLHWVPQENILFDGARLVRRMETRLTPGSTLFAVDIRVFGRRASGERWNSGRLDERWRIWVGDRLIWCDALQVEDPASAMVDPLRFSGAEAYGTAAFVGVDPLTVRDAVRGISAEVRWGVTIVNDIVLVRAWATRLWFGGLSRRPTRWRRVARSQSRGRCDPTALPLPTPRKEGLCT